LLPRDPGGAASDLGYLGAIAVSAAILAGYACSVTLPVRNGMLMLPALGRALISGSHATVVVSGSGKATITSGDQVVTISDPHADAPGWQPLRLLAMGDRQLMFDDLDPNRSYDPYPLPGRLSTTDVTHWQNSLNEAWHLLTLYHPGHAAALRGGLRSLVPIGRRADDRNVSATSEDAFGAVAASIPSDGAALAVALLHEFQHSKLCAINYLAPLCHRAAGQLFYAPWRPDPRPADALLHGIFAHLAVADFWRVHRSVAPGRDQLVADVEFARWLRQTYHAARLLDGCGGLTAAGRQVLAEVTARLAEWLDEPVPGPATKLAEETSADHLGCWRLRNLKPVPADVERLASDWMAGRPARAVVRTRVREDPLTAGRNIRPDLLYARLRDPGRWERDNAGRRDDPDVAYARGDHEAAVNGYLAQLSEDPARLHAWTGLGLATNRLGALIRCPDLVYALHGRLAQLPVPPVEPLRLARWLDDVSVCDLEVHV
jgi:HEXXH motif-containing protein